MEHVLTTDQLARRPSRAPAHETEARALRALGRELATNPGGVLQLLVELVRELCRADSAGVSVLEPGGENGVLRWQAIAGAFAGNLNGTMPRDASPCGVVMAQDSVLLFNEPERVYPGLRTAEPRIHEALLAPWRHMGEPAGTVWAVTHTRDEWFDAEDARLLSSLAAFAAAAWQVVTSLQDAEAGRREPERRVEDRTRSLGEGEKRLEVELATMRLLHDLHARLAGETDPFRALDAILAAAVELTGADRGTVQLVSDDGERLEIVAQRGHRADSRFIERSRHEGAKPACEADRRDRQRLIIEDVERYPGLAGTVDREAALADGIRAIQSTPMITRKGELVGMLSTQFSRPHRPGDEELRLVDLLVWSAADFIERHRGEVALRTGEEQQAFLLELSDALRPLDDPAEAESSTCRLLERFFARDTDSGDGALGAEGSVTFHSVPQATVQSSLGKAFVVPDVEASEELRPEVREMYLALGIRSLVSVPLVRNGELVWTLGATSGTARDWAPADVALIRQAGERMWQAIDRLRTEAAIRERDERYRMIVEEATDYAIFTTNVENRIATWSPGAAAVFGWSAEEAIGKLADMVFTPEDRAAGEPAREYAGARDAGSTPDVRWHQRKDGGRVYIEGTAYAVRGPKGEFRGLFKIGQDLTERRRAEEALRESEERLRALVLASSYAIYRMSPDWRQMHQLDGRGFIADTDQPSSDWLETYIEPDDRPLVLDAIASAVRSKRVFELEHRVRRADGTIGWTLSRAIPILDANGEVAEWFGAASDITDAKRADIALRESEERYRVLLENLPDYAIFMLDRDGRISQWTDGAGAILGYSEDEIIGQHVSVFYPAGDVEARVVERELARAVEAGRAEREGWQVRRSGEPFWANEIVTAIRDETGEVQGFSKISRDLTERRRAEVALRESEERYRSLFTSMDEAYAVVEVIPDGTGGWSDFRFLEVNPAFMKHTGMPYPTGRTATELLGTPNPRWAEIYGQVVETGEPVRIEESEQVLGRTFDLNIFRLDGPPDRRVAVLFTDITARKRAEDALRESEASLQRRVSEATEELRSLSRRLLSVQEEERRHLARELHDEIGQTLTGLGFQLRPKGSASDEPLAEARRTVQELTEQVRQLSMDLRPAALDMYGLLPAARWHLDRYQTRTGVRVDLRQEGLDRRFPAEVETAAFRVMQEALTNVARHAGVQAATVQMLADSQALTLVVRDEGRGFDPAAMPGAGGLGGMRERVELLGGELTIDAAPGEGTVVTAELPLADLPLSENER